MPSIACSTNMFENAEFIIPAGPRESVYELQIEMRPPEPLPDEEVVLVIFHRQNETAQAVILRSDSPSAAGKLEIVDPGHPAVLKMTLHAGAFPNVGQRFSVEIAFQKNGMPPTKSSAFRLSARTITSAEIPG